MTPPSRILIVEDDDTLREILGEVMTDDGHDVRLAGDGEEALNQIADWEPEVVVLDVMMPRMNAFEFRDAQRRSGAAAAARILVLSAVPNLETAAAKLGATAWLAKPFSLKDFAGVVGDLMNRHGRSVST